MQTEIIGAKELKVLIPYYEDIISGIKTFEVRKNDRDFKVGDILKLREFQAFYKEDYDTEGNLKQGLDEQMSYGRDCYAEVTYLLDIIEFGLQPGYVVMGIKLLQV
jgi:hypothetical protein